MNKEQMTIKALFDTSKTQAGRRLSKYTYPWEVLPHIDRRGNRQKTSTG